MATISENLQIIADSTAAIKQAIIDKGGEITGDITTWADAISGISGGGSSVGEEEITFTGDFDSEPGGISINGYISKSFDTMKRVIALTWGDGGLLFRTYNLQSNMTDISMSLSSDSPFDINPADITMILMDLTGGNGQIIKINI